MSATSSDTNVLDVKGLQTVFFTNSGLFRAVDDVSFHVKRGETLAIVGESGCGKSVSALSIMRLVPNPPGRIVGGEILLDGTDLLALDEARMREIRGNRISMIFQEPMTSLNPVIRIGDQISEAVRLHRDMSAKAAWEQAVEMLRLVRIPEPARRAQEYPHQRLTEIPGTVPALTRLPKGCAFAPRCKLAIDRCLQEYPPLQDFGGEHLAACWRAAETVVAA
jgi:oligopeptide/dipeptide ABC transporter ATP-binding protein